MTFTKIKQSNLQLLFILMLVGCLSQIASDVYAPSLPAIAHSLDTSISLTQVSMTIYMFGLAISQLFYGTLSEFVGRRKPLILGLSIMFIGSVICSAAQNIQILLVGRFIQGCGAGACAALWRSIFRDIFNGAELAKYGAYLSIAITFIVPAAPTLGGYLEKFFGWQSIFIFLAIYSCFAIHKVKVALQETNKFQSINSMNWLFIKKSYHTLLSSRIFMGYTCCTFLSYGAFFAWFASGPILVIDIVGLTPVSFGWVTFITGAISTAIAGYINGKFIEKVGTKFMLRTGWIIMFIAGLLLFIGNLIFGVKLMAIMLPMFLFYFGVSFIWPSAFANAFKPFPHIAGVAGSLYGFMQILGAAVMGGIVSYLPSNSQTPLALVIMLSSFVAWLIFERAVIIPPLNC